MYEGKDRVVDGDSARTAFSGAFSIEDHIQYLPKVRPSFLTLIVVMLSVIETFFVDICLRPVCAILALGEIHHLVKRVQYLGSR